jgi:hypothetical protein
MATKWLTTPTLDYANLLAVIRSRTEPTKWDATQLFDTEDLAVEHAMLSSLHGQPCKVQQVDDAAYLSTKQKVQKILRIYE